MRRDPLAGCAQIATNICVVGGLLLVPFAFAVDYILPNASPGISYVQLLIMAAGLAIALIAWQFKRPEIQRKLIRSWGRSIAAGIIVTLLTLVILEIVLGAFGMTTYFPQSPPETLPTVERWLICDEPGCRHVYEEVQIRCAEGHLTGRDCIINRQGYGDSQDFITPAEYDDELRVLVLGDSFTFGRTAEIGKSYVEYLESRFPEIEIWNTGIVGAGTNQAVETFKWFAPQLRPQLTILGFVTNDYNDNLFPVDSRIRVFSPSLNYFPLLRTHYYDIWGNAFAYDPQDVLRYYANVHGPPRNSIEYALGITNLGTLALHLRDAVGPLLGSLKATKIKVTRQYLADLRDLTRVHNSALLVILVPYHDDLNEPSTLFLKTKQLLAELDIAYMDPAHLLDATADYAMPPDGHWSTAGHQKVGAYLSECVAVFIESEDLSQCDGVVISGNRP